MKGIGLSRILWFIQFFTALICELFRFKRTVLATPVLNGCLCNQYLMMNVCTVSLVRSRYATHFAGNGKSLIKAHSQPVRRLG